MANFDAAIDFILKWEGGYGEDEVDLGGLQTYRGISRKHNPNWAGWKIIDQRKPKQWQIYQDLEDDVKSFYKKHYWDAIKADGICNDKIAAFMFDWYVNSGGHAVKAVQRIVGTTQDGILGNQTLHAINNYNGALYEPLRMARISFYKKIVKDKPAQNKFLIGWLNRVNDFDKDFS
ncbi:hypothetical protein VF04_36720 [Nostoc linckia z7]|uniref:Peptidoglycan domain protein n=1 Tax=Nostoc linckia z7 TaxID=1628745 RepID=A0ABX4KC01_NOSLI|nr:glycosyl hydrolase 108 family protein [Nostoc linckia]PHJ51671.1 hypothetical protein VF02_37805 [Nostoc linckia z1]PHJ59305.1 hypothetical protein VF05_32455 [Nostoc linckia z3]PHJ63630.1 hypothetical protein VF03_29965 [Nostoc linckia z2]PHJ70434.1 hypothetical protein VF06_37660 [Nostoc linckia z4]PHJ83476.1 hypothetical protein VF04_36720 [Nostoc linckia z7]